MASYGRLSSSTIAVDGDFADLPIYSEGCSLRLSTRNFPQKSIQDDDDSQGVNNLTKEEAEKLYAEFGKNLKSSNMLAGYIKLASQQTQLLNGGILKLYVGLGCALFLLVGFGGLIAAHYKEIEEAHTHPSKDEIEELITNLGIYLGLALGPAVLWVVFERLDWLVFPKFGNLKKKLLCLQPMMSQCEISNDELESLMLERDCGLCDCKVVGSAGDGFGFFASMGSNKLPFESRTVITQDLDLNIFLNGIAVKPENISPIPDVGEDSLGFTWLKGKPAEISDPLIGGSLLLTDGPEEAAVISGYEVGEQGQQQFQFQNQTQTQTQNQNESDDSPLGRITSGQSRQMLSKVCPCLASVEAANLLGDDDDDASRQSFLPQHPALTLTTETRGPNGVQKYEVDFAFALRYPFWPEEAAEWITRSRYGVDRTTIQTIVRRGCYLVHKPCVKAADDNPYSSEERKLDWRFTFASAEADLFHYHRDKKALKLCFVILKFLLKFSRSEKPKMIRRLEAWAGHRLTEAGTGYTSLDRSYLLKTIFLWMAEEETTLDYYRVEENDRLDEIFTEMLTRYINALRNRFLPNYFISHRNMIGSRCTAEELEKSTKLLENIKKNPAVWVTKFERQFVNAKIRLAFALFLAVIAVAGIAFYAREVSSLRSHYGHDWRPLIPINPSI